MMLGRLRHMVVGWVLSDVQVGGHCGCCGRWVPDALTEAAWPWTLCPDCQTAGRPTDPPEGRRNAGSTRSGCGGRDARGARAKLGKP